MGLKELKFGELTPEQAANYRKGVEEEAAMPVKYKLEDCEISIPDADDDSIAYAKKFLKEIEEKGRRDKMVREGNKSKKVICQLRQCVYNTDNSKCVLRQIDLDEYGRCQLVLKAERDYPAPVNHLNYCTEDGIYCRREHTVINNIEGCHQCRFLFGSLQGEGVECYWDDVVSSPFYIHDPGLELIRVENLINKGVLEKYPARESIRSDMVQEAERLAIAAHKGQVDKAGADYIEHPRYVASLLQSDDEKAVAWLHDIVEDTDMTIEKLAVYFPDFVVEAVAAITKIKGEGYDAYLTRVKANPIARAVKLADLTHNMKLDKLPSPTEKDYKRLEKYRHAYAVLSEDADKI